MYDNDDDVVLYDDDPHLQREMHAPGSNPPKIVVVPVRHSTSWSPHLQEGLEEGDDIVTHEQ